MIILITLIALIIVAQLAELRYRLRANPTQQSQYSQQVARILQSVDEYRQEMRTGMEAIQRQPTTAPASSHDMAGLVTATENRFAHLQRLVEGLQVHEPVVPIPGEIIDHDVPRPILTDTKTLKLLDTDGSEVCEVAWHREEVPALYKYADQTYYLHGQRVDGIWEFKHVA